MRAFYTVLFCVLLMACGDKKEGDKQNFLPASNGNLNTISVVSDNIVWEGAVGESIRNIFAAPLTGLPTDEPLFSMKQIPTQVFDGFAARNRIVIKIDKANVEASTEIKNDVYAKPQTVALITGKTDQEIIAQLEEHKEKIIDALTKEEVKEKQRRIKLSLLDVKKMESQLGFTINIPSVYRISKAEDKFFWVRKNLSNAKTMELMFYEVPFETISNGDSTIVDIVKMRDEITKTKIPGEDGIYMAVEDAYAPSMFKTIIDNKPAYEVRGLWDMQGYTMAGPFITYAIEDKINNRYLVADGYVYAPSLEKRDYIFELESIIKSIKIK
ncbi:uncharacterized protein DUF4837 [Winogradskyella epiphytica]|uniref:Uncharacterized protein DUF4837 n=1 Tax=Winogradskyella epiphytica TaxID=262005 RepID=A0A2V4XB76_9FLAO|nr:DUF4837 family protein [Winogradskyella epiphytica]PYE83305.1 uncharacterized protein DUF4837 [Winogradskyella epiphytica]GGW57195.1 hypothetical protein GCM10008085_05990 [Winogradskyella epiphytica]